jgi:hypothetical protein
LLQGHAVYPLIAAFQVRWSGSPKQMPFPLPALLTKGRQLRLSSNPLGSGSGIGRKHSGQDKFLLVGSCGRKLSARFPKN